LSAISRSLGLNTAVIPHSRHRNIHASRLLSDYQEGPLIGVVNEEASALQFCALHVVFGGQICVPRQQLLVYRPRGVGQDARPIHNGPFA
jgi:hypothetical protein